MKNLMFRLILTLVMLLMAGSAWGATYLVHSGGSDTSPYDTEAKAATQVENVLDNIDVEPGDIIQLRSDITEADQCTWGIGDEGSAAGYVTLDLNGKVWSSSAVTTLHLADTLSYVHITNGTIQAGSITVSGIKSTDDGDHLRISKIVFNDNGEDIGQWIDIISIGAEQFSGVEIDSCSLIDSDHNDNFLHFVGDVSAKVTNCIVDKSTAVMYVGDDGTGKSPTLGVYNCTFYNPTAGIYLNTNVDPTTITIYNCNFHSISYGVNDSSGGATDPVLDYNTWYNNTNDVVNCSKGAHAVTADPLFIDAANGNFGLQSTSPCIDKGFDVTQAPYNILTDRRGAVRKYGDGVDMGSDEYIKHEKRRWWRRW